MHLVIASYLAKKRPKSKVRHSQAVHLLNRSSHVPHGVFVFLQLEQKVLCELNPEFLSDTNNLKL